jgi:hypothetical protein
LYPRLTGRSDFEQSLTGPQVSSVLQALTTAPLNHLLGSRPGGQPPSQAKLMLSLPVTTSSYAPPPSGGSSSGGPASVGTLTLGCEGYGLICDGVYPLQIGLVDLAGKSLGTFTTYLIYGTPSEISGARPLRVAWVMPLGVGPTTTTGGQAILGSQDGGSIETVLTALRHDPGVYVNLETYGETVLALQEGAAHRGPDRSTMSLLRSVADNQPNTAIIPGTFAPIDIAGFESSGLSAEFADQLRRGSSAIRKALPDATLLTSAPAVLSAPVNVGEIAMLESQGISSFVLPENQLAPDGWNYTATEPFRLKLPPGDGLSQPLPKAIVSDSQLSTLFSSTADQQLAAYQLLADLAEIFFELPYSRQARAVVLVTPDTWQPTKAMLDALLHGLDSASDAGILSTTSLTSTIQDLVSGGNSEPAVRTLASGGAASSSTLNTSSPPDVSASEITSARQAAAALSSLVPTDKTQLGTLQTLILGGEASDLPPTGQAALLGIPAADIAAWGSLVTLPEDITVTLTSSQGQIPITIESHAPIPLHVKLLISNPEGGIKFPGATSVPLVLTGRTVANVQVSTRTSGDFSLQIELVTPTGNVVIDKANVTVRSTAFSGLAIGLSVGALVLLAGWWIRSTRRRRRARLAEEAALEAGDPDADEAQAAAAASEGEREVVGAPIGEAGMPNSAAGAAEASHPAVSTLVEQPAENLHVSVEGS